MSPADPDELPMRPAEGRVGAGIFYASPDIFTSGKNRDHTIDLLHPVVKPPFAGRSKAAVKTAKEGPIADIGFFIFYYYTRYRYER